MGQDIGCLGAMGPEEDGPPQLGTKDASQEGLELGLCLEHFCKTKNTKILNKKTLLIKDASTFARSLPKQFASLEATSMLRSQDVASRETGRVPPQPSRD